MRTRAPPKRQEGRHDERGPGDDGVRVRAGPAGHEQPPPPAAAAAAAARRLRGREPRGGAPRGAALEPALQRGQHPAAGVRPRGHPDDARPGQAVAAEGEPAAGAQPAGPGARPQPLGQPAVAALAALAALARGLLAAPGPRLARPEADLVRAQPQRQPGEPRQQQELRHRRLPGGLGRLRLLRGLERRRGVRQRRQRLQQRAGLLQRAEPLARLDLLHEILRQTLLW